MKFAVFAAVFAAAAGLAAEKRADDTEISVWYVGDTNPTLFEWGDCIELRRNGAPLERGYVSRDAECFLYGEAYCVEELPGMLVIPQDVDMVNAADFAGRAAESAECFPL